MTGRDPRVRELPPIRTSPLLDIVVDLDPPRNFGDGPSGKRVFFAAAGGSFSGPEVGGDVLAGGGDWATFRPDGTMALDVRLTLATDDGALVLMTYGGRFVVPPDLRKDMDDPATRLEVDPGRYYFRTNPLFETGASRYAWLNDLVCVGFGYPVDGGVAYRVERVD